jgi:signal peptidase I
MGSGISIHQYYDVQNNRLSEEYSYVAAASGNLLAYIDTISTKEPINHRKLVVRDIFDPSVFYKSFRLDFSSNVHDPIESASFSQGEMELKIVYWSDYYIPITHVLPIRYNVPGGIYASEAENAMDAFSEVLKNDIPVYEVNGTTIESELTLKDIKTPYNGTPLSEIENLKYIYFDMDGDYVKELIIDCGDILVLRYYEGYVYVYPFTFRNMYNLKTDGSYGWNYTGQNFEYGESKLAFDGVELKTKGIWRIVNDGESNAEYYIGDKKVTREEILSYFENNPKSDVELTALETTWKDQLSVDEALEIAKKYWKDSCGDEEEYEFVLIYKYVSDYSVYVFLVRSAPYTPDMNITEIWVDKYTGEIIPPNGLG